MSTPKNERSRGERDGYAPRGERGDYDNRGGRGRRQDDRGRDDRRDGGRRGGDDRRPHGRDDRRDGRRDDDRGRGGYRGRDDKRGRDDRRDDRRGGGRFERDDRRPHGRDDRRPHGRDDRRDGRRDDDRGRGGYRGRDDKRGRDDRRDDRRGGGRFERDDRRPHGRDDRRPHGRDDRRPHGRDDRRDGRRDDDRGRGGYRGRDDKRGRDNRRDNNRRDDRDRRDQRHGQRPVRRGHAAPAGGGKSENQLSKAARERLNALRADYDPRDEDRRSGEPRDTYTDVQDGIRLQKALAAAGVASRRASEEMIAAGRVSVDGQIVRRFGARVDPEVSEIRVDDMRVVTAPDKLYFALNKPRGVVSTMWDPQGRPNLADYAGQTAERIFHVGRLDTETEGLILLTNDGDLANRLTHPRYKVVKTYVAKVPGPVPQRVVRQIQKGVELEDGPVRVDSFRVVDNDDTQAMVEIRLHEGRKHIVRRLMEAVGHPIADLARTQVGPIDLNTLRLGTMRALSSREVGELYKTAGL
ncbi:pseudouridine synthase [Nocardiopsis oceani]